MHGKMRIVLILCGFAALMVLPFAAFLLLRQYAIAASGALGYFNAWWIAVVTNATILVPTPSTIPLVVEIAEHNNLVAVAAVYAMGSAVGELSSYLLGDLIGAFPVTRMSRTHKRVEEWMQGKYIGARLCCLAAVPLTPFDVGGMIAGNARYPWYLFLCATAFGRWIKYLYTIPFWQFFEGALSHIGLLRVAAPFLLILVLFTALLWIERELIREGIQKLRASWAAG